MPRDDDFYVGFIIMIVRKGLKSPRPSCRRLRMASSRSSYSGLRTLISIVQLVLGKIVLSALLFISFLDALPILLWHGASASICNLLLRIELAGLRYRLEATHGVGARERTIHISLGVSVKPLGTCYLANNRHMCVSLCRIPANGHLDINVVYFELCSLSQNPS